MLGGPVRLVVVTALVAAVGWSGRAWGAVRPAAPGTAAPAASSSPADKGPVGWDVYRRLDRMAEIPVGTETRSFSSFDRTGGNDDGFSGKYSCLSTSATGCLIASHDGPGEIDSMWFTRSGPNGLGDVSQDGNLVVQLDGRTLVNKPLESLVESTTPPFAYPLVADRFETSGAVYIKVPMPFRQSMRVYTTANPHFYHLDYRVFSDSVGVSTFDPSDPALDVFSMLQNANSTDPKPPAVGATTTSQSFSVDPGNSTTLATEIGPGSISALHLSLPALSTLAPSVTPSATNRAVSGAVQVPLDPSNDGASLTYQGPAGTPPQDAPLVVDGQRVGAFSAPAPGANGTQTLSLPRAATAGKSATTLKNVLLVPGSTLTVTSLRGGRPVRTDTVHPSPPPANAQPAVSTAASSQAASVLDGLRVRLSFDGQQTVDLPAGQFFASPLTGSPVDSLLLVVQPPDLRSWQLMPYTSTATVQLYNASGATVSGSSDVTAAPSPTWTTALAPGGDAGYFHAASHEASTTSGVDFPLLDQGGAGKLLGVSLTMRGSSPGLLFLEGDQRFSVDGSRTPQEQGTGTEDFFEGGWYFSNGPFTAPFNGLVTEQNGTNGCAFECLSAYRLFVADSVPFHAAAHLSIQHGPANDVNADYTATAYYYVRTNPSIQETSAVDLGQPASESNAQFTVQGSAPVGSLRSSFEGPYDTVAVTASDRTGTGATSFTLPADPAAGSVVIRRTTDQAVAGQAGEVFVNGQDAGRWSEPLGNTFSRWLDDDFRIPPAITTGSGSLQISIRPVAGSPPWSAARYALLSEGTDAADTTAPVFTGSVAASLTSGGLVNLSWLPAADDSPSLHYQVYRSTSPSPTPATATLLGDIRMTGFIDTAPPLNTTVYYIAVPIDESGNVGNASPVAVIGTSRRLRLEGESTPSTATAPSAVQSMAPFGPGWSGGAQEWLKATGPGQSLTFSIQVASTATYGLTLGLTRARDYGLATVSVDGRRLGPTYDGYGPTVAPSGPRAFGFVSLPAGPHTVTLTVVGRNPASAGYFVGVDYLQFDDVGQGDPILAKASALASTGLDLGSPVGSEQAAGPGIAQTFQRGLIAWTPDTGAHEVHGAIWARYQALGGVTSFLGFPVTDETKTPDGVGRFNHFTNSASIYWTPGTGAWSIHGAIRAKWASLGWERSFLGYPTTDETGTPDGVGRFNHFSSTASQSNVNGSIYWTPGTGAWSVHGLIRAKWASMGWERSCLGYPTTDEFAIPGGRQSNFQRGYIAFSFATGVATPSC